MSDMSATIIPKSDQLNADDLIAGPRAITVREVRIAPGTEQPVAVYFDGDDGKPYLPCKSMRRVMVTIWGPDASVYSGRSMTLYRDPAVTWGGMEVGGIRISHMSNMEKQTIVVLTATKKARKPFTVAPLVAPERRAERAAPTDVNEARAKARALTNDTLKRISEANEGGLHDMAGSPRFNGYRDRLKEKFPAMDQEIADAMTARFAELKGTDA